MTLPGNSIGKESKEKVLLPVIVGEASPTKPTLGSKFHDALVGDDARSVGRYVLADVVLPSIRNLIVDVTKRGIERLVYGDSTPRRPDNSRGVVSYSSYSSPYRVGSGYGSGYGKPAPPAHKISTSRDSYTFELREDAMLVVDTLNDIIESYGTASVSDLRELIGLKTDSVDNRWGWTTPVKADIRQTRNGWVLEMPAPKDL